MTVKELYDKLDEMIKNGKGNYVCVCALSETVLGQEEIIAYNDSQEVYK